MSDTLQTLSQSELFALALEASRREDAGRALAYLKEAGGRADATPQALFLLGSEYAQLGLMPDAKAHMSRAVEAAPDFAVARFQLGMLHVTSGEVDTARGIWAPLAELADDHPQGYLKHFHAGMLNLVADEFDAAIAALSAGLAQNTENEALNKDMQRVIDAIQHLPGRAAAAEQAEAAGAPQAASPDDAPAEVEPSHLFINAYNQRGKPH